MFDVLVIGAGPAGSFAAERLARAGANVALFDGRAKGEPKACGGGVTTKALKHWPELKIAPARFVDEVDLYSPVGSYIKLKLREPFAIYSRATLDSYLKNRARAAGATIIDQKVRLREQSPWVVEGDRKWSGRFLVAADGANSPLAKKLSGPIANSEMEVAFGYRVPLPATKTPRTSIVFLDSCPGYFWAFPRPDHISFGIATLQSRFSHKPLDSLLWKLIVAYYSSPDGLKTHWLSESALIQESPLLEKLKSSAQPYAARIPGLSSETLKRRKTAGEDWALVGDAAGFADPLTGEGIYYALKSAELFANAY
jgi:geranylgeranyl reductase family protein